MGAGDAEPETVNASGAPTCPTCGEYLYKRHCKYVCPNHGPVIDCSDPFR